MKKKPARAELVGFVFERSDGTRFLVEKQDGQFVYYWLAAGSRPQFRSVAIENLHRYKRVPGINRKGISE